MRQLAIPAVFQSVSVEKHLCPIFLVRAALKDKRYRTPGFFCLPWQNITTRTILSSNDLDACCIKFDLSISGSASTVNWLVYS